MSGEERRQKILEKIQAGASPASGASLAREFSVSRQVIVQDIALLRAAGNDIISTHRGYLCQSPALVSRVFKMYHTDQETEEELCCMVDNGGIVQDVFVRHRVYGHLRAELGIRSRKQIQELLQDIAQGKSVPLKNVTSGYHYHTVLADSVRTLDCIEEELKKKGFLLENRKVL